MEQNRHSLVAKGIMVLLSLLVLIFAFTVSWFTNKSEPVSASGISLRTSSTADFECSVGFKTSQTNNEYLHTAFTNNDEIAIDLENLTATSDNKRYNLLEDYTPIDVTGNGSTLIRPSMSYGNWSVDTSTDNYSIATPNVQYISFDLIVRAKKACTISLDKESFAKGWCESYPGDSDALSGANASNKSTYGSFSKDAIVGATRVAFIDYDTEGVTAAALVNNEQTALNPTPSLLWVTRPDVYLDNKGNDNSVSGWELKTDVGDRDLFNLNSKGHTESNYSTYKHQYYSVFNSSQKTVVDYTDAKTSSIGEDGTVKFNQSAEFLDVNVYGGDSFYYGKVNVRIWVEGTDSESRRALSGGKFSVNFDLTSN